MGNQDIKVNTNYLKLVSLLLVMGKSAHEGLSKARVEVTKSGKVYSGYKAISEKEAELDISQQGESGVKEAIPTPPQLLTSTQAGIISSYIISRLLSKPKILKMPKSLTQQEVSVGVEKFVTSSQNKYDWRLKLNKVVHSMTKYGPAGILVIPREEGIDFEVISAGNGYFDPKKKEGMCVLNKGYDFLMGLLDLNAASLTQLGRDIQDKPAILHHVRAKNYGAGYYDIKTNCQTSVDSLSGLSHQERLNTMLNSVPIGIGSVGDKLNTTKAKKQEQSPLKIKLNKGCGSCITQEEVSAYQLLEVMSGDYDITFNTMHIDSRLAKVDEFKSNKVVTGNHRQMYLIISVNGYPLVVKHITSELIMMSDLYLTADNEQADNLPTTLAATEKYNTDYHRAILLGLKDIVNQANIFFDEDVFIKKEGRWTIKSQKDLSGKVINPRDHMVELSSPAGNIAAITQVLPDPAGLANQLTGNNALLSATHIKGNRTALESQNLTQNSESRFFVFAGNFFMNIINKLARTTIDLIVANPQWISVMNPKKDKFITPSVKELILYKEKYYEEQTGLIPTSLGSPEAASAIINMLGTNQELGRTRDMGDVLNYLAESLGFSDFPEIRPPHERGDRLTPEESQQLANDVRNAQDLNVATQLIQGTAPSQQQNLTPEQLAEQQAQAQVQTIN